MNAKKAKAIRQAVARIEASGKLQAFGLIASPVNPRTARVNPRSARGLTQSMKKTAVIKKGAK